MKQHFDCIIAGGGCAGLSLAYHLVSQGYSGSILILDREQKNKNDRTWCWWSKAPTPFDSILSHQWHHLSFADSLGVLTQAVAPYRYSLLRSIHFYQFIQQHLATCANVVLRQANIESIEEADTGAIVRADGISFSAEQVFSSIPAPRKSSSKPEPGLIQHFAGWWVETAEDTFDPSSATLMDFRVPQDGETRFVYVLPTSKRNALIEYTLFSTKLLGNQAYEVALEDYLKNVLKVTSYQILEKEFGVIPMEILEPEPVKRHRHIINIGTIGGAVKPTTGYAFARIQEQTKQIAQQLIGGRKLNPKLIRAKRFEFYDHLMLHILTHRGGLGSSIFSSLFKRIELPLILKFMDEGTQLTEEFRILASLPPGPFLQAVWESNLGINKSMVLPPNPVHQ